MTPDSTGIVGFLLARIAEDEAAAKRAAFGYGAGWTSVSDDVDDWSAVHADGKRDMVGCEDRDVTRHIARHDPARVLRRCEADRRIIAFALTYRENAEQETVASRKFIAEIMAETAADALKPLALPFADHPDYREEWRP